MNKKNNLRNFLNLILILELFLLIAGERNTVSAAVQPLGTSIQKPIIYAAINNRDVIIERAKRWADLKVPYSKDKYYDGYRTDCSGYVSYAWGLTNSSGNPLNLYTGNLVNNAPANLISKDQLQKGDILLNSTATKTDNLHTLIFVSWANTDKTKYNAYELSPYYMAAKYVTNIPYPYWTAYEAEKYKPYSLKGLTTSTPKCTVPVGSFCGEYYNGTSLSGNAVFTQNTGSINYNWGNSGPGNGIGNDNFSVRWQGSFGFDSATYTFNATSDDGINLYVDNVLQINAWKEQASTTYTKDVTLSSGNHTIKIEYFEKSGGAVAQVSWVKKLVPTYGSVWVSQSTYPTITQGGTADVWVKFKNMGNTTWYNYGSKRTLLGTLHPTTGAIDYNSPFVCSPGWAGSNRPVVMSEGSVAPGGTGTFAFRLCAPSNLSPGTYRVAVAPLVDSVSWMKPPTFVYWDVKVNAKSTPNLAQGRSTWATSQESSNYPSSRAVDGNTGTRWSSKISSTLGEQWLTVDLGSIQSINQIVIRWEAAYARDYFVGYSTASNCSTATYSGWNYTATSRQDKTIDFSSASARCIGIKMRQRAPGMNNFSIYEIEVYKK